MLPGVEARVKARKAKARKQSEPVVREPKRLEVRSNVSAPLPLQLIDAALTPEERERLRHEMAPPSMARVLAHRTELMVRAARRDAAAFASYVLRDEETNLPVHLTPMHNEWHSLFNRHPRLLLWSHVEAGKAVPLDTEIPTPEGWTTMGALQPGDVVFGRDGKPCRVRAVSEVQHGREVFEIEFSDGVRERADADHNWAAWSVDDRAAKRAPRVVTTRQMLDRLRRGRDWMWTIPVAAPVVHIERQLPVHPYVLGAWLGDGDSAAPTLTFHKNDQAIFDRCRELEGGDCTPKGNGDVLRGSLGFTSKRQNHNPTRLRARLRTLGVLGNKHIPEAYLQASIEQRRELLAGLLDTDGSIDHRGGKSRIEFCSSSALLAQGVVQLVRSLGFKARIAESDSKLNGTVIGRRWRITFTAHEPVFWLERKRALQKHSGHSGAALKRTVIAIRPVASVPVKCITVDSEDHTFLMGRSYTVTHNTTQMSVARVLFTLGRNPNARVVIVSNTDGQAQKICRTIAKYIESSKELHEVFPNLKPSETANVWTKHELIIERPSKAKDASVATCGIHGNILGARIDLLILDDLLDHENTLSPTQREDLWAWYHSTLEGRLTRHAKVLCIGTAWHRDDFMHRVARKRSWKCVRYPILNAADAPTWPDRWPRTRIEEKRDTLGPTEFARQLMCVARTDEEARFKRAWIDACLARGLGKKQCWALERVPEGYGVFTGVDLGVKQKATSDWTVLFTICVHPNGDREVLNITSGRWTGPDIVQKIVDIHHRYRGIVYVEDNAAQHFIYQFVKKQSAVPVKPYTTTAASRHPEFGIESIATEMSNAKWIIPCDRSPEGQFVAHPEVEAWINELLYYDPRSHPGDRLMASFFAREGANSLKPKGRTAYLDTLSR